MRCSVTAGPAAVASPVANDPAGTLVLGGGEANNSTPGNIVLTDSLATGSRTWTVFVRNFGPTTQTFFVSAVCGA